MYLNLIWNLRFKVIEFLLYECSFMPSPYLPNETNLAAINEFVSG